MIFALAVAGSVPFGLIITKLASGQDVRAIGSGNIGATNVARLLGKKYFWVVFFLDLLKSMIPVAIASALAHRIPPEQRDWGIYLLWLLVGFAAVMGHMFSIFLRFKGGKGVATSAGVMLGLVPYFTIPACISILVFIVAFFATRYVSVGSISGAASFPIAYFIVGKILDWPVMGTQLPLLIVSVIMCGLIIYKHRGNIARLMNGTENRMTRSFTTPTPRD